MDLSPEEFDKFLISEGINLSLDEMESSLILHNGFLSSAYHGNVKFLREYSGLAKDHGYEFFTFLKTLRGGFNALHLAACRGHTKACKFLIEEMKFDVKSADREGETPLLKALFNEHWSTAKYLTESDADPNSFSPPNKSPLLLSMQADSIECMELLLKGGADPNYASEFQTTPLCFAAAKPSLQMTQCLLKYGADPDMLDHNGKKALEYAAMMNCHEVVELLYPKTEPIASYTDWSISGIMQHAPSEQAKLKELCLKEKENGSQALLRKDYASARDCYSRAMGTYWTDAQELSRLLHNRSFCLVYLDEGYKALNDARICVKLDPVWPMGHFRVGAAFHFLKDYREAVEAFGRALELEPGNEKTESAQRRAKDELDKWGPSSTSFLG